MRNINKVLLSVVIVLLVALVAVLAWQFWFATPSYYAVYLRTGDLYFGELTTFPNFGLSHVYMLQVNSQDKQNPVSVQKFTNIFWGPEDFLNINRNEVVWYAKIDPQGQLASLLASNPNLLPANSPATGSTGTAPTTATSTSGK